MSNYTVDTGFFILRIIVNLLFTYYKCPLQNFLELHPLLTCIAAVHRGFLTVSSTDFILVLKKKSILLFY